MVEKRGRLCGCQRIAEHDGRDEIDHRRDRHVDLGNRVTIPLAQSLVNLVEGTEVRRHWHPSQHVVVLGLSPLTDLPGETFGDSPSVGIRSANSSTMALATSTC